MLYHKKEIIIIYIKEIFFMKVFIGCNKKCAVCDFGFISEMGETNNKLIALNMQIKKSYSIEF